MAELGEKDPRWPLSRRTPNNCLFKGKVSSEFAFIYIPAFDGRGLVLKAVCLLPQYKVNGFCLMVLNSWAISASVFTFDLSTALNTFPNHVFIKAFCLLFVLTLTVNLDKCAQLKSRYSPMTALS